VDAPEAFENCVDRVLRDGEETAAAHVTEPDAPCEDRDDVGRAAEKRPTRALPL
jgi:hypothetical protein